MIEIKIIKQDGSKQEATLDHFPFEIGRGSENDFVISDPSVSTTHAVFEERPYGYYIRDLQSTNGLYFGDNLISELKIAPGQIFHLGEVKIEILDIQSPTVNGKETMILNRSSLVLATKPRAPEAQSLATGLLLSSPTRTGTIYAKAYNTQTTENTWRSFSLPILLVFTAHYTLSLMNLVVNPWPALRSFGSECLLILMFSAFLLGFARLISTHWLDLGASSGFYPKMLKEILWFRAFFITVGAVPILLYQIDKSTYQDVVMTLASSVGFGYFFFRFWMAARPLAQIRLAQCFSIFFGLVFILSTLSVTRETDGSTSAYAISGVYYPWQSITRESHPASRFISSIDNSYAKIQKSREHEPRPIESNDKEPQPK